MNDDNMLKIFNVFIGVLVGLISLVSAILPIISETFLTNIFIDTEIILFTSILGLALLLFATWLTTSIDFFIMLKFDLNKMARYRTISIFGVLLLILLLYIFKILYNAHWINLYFGAILQTTTYLLLFTIMGIHLGTALQSTLQAAKNKRDRSEIIDKLNLLLIHSGHAKIKILGFDKKNPQDIVYNKTFVQIHDKFYKLSISNDLETILKTEELTEAELKEEFQEYTLVR